MRVLLGSPKTYHLLDGPQMDLHGLYNLKKNETFDFKCSGIANNKILVSRVLFPRA